MSDYTAEEIAQAISDMQAAGATNEQIAQAAADAGVSVSEIAAATGAPAESIQSVFDGAGISAPGGPASSGEYGTSVPVGASEPAPVYEPPPEPAPVYEPPAPEPAPVAAPAPVAPTAPTVQDNVNTWFQQNPNATPTDVLQAIQAAGGMTPEIAAAVGAHYGTDAGAVQTYYTANMPAPVAPGAADNVSAATQPAAPVAPPPAPEATPAPVAPSTNLDQYNSQTQNAVKNAGLDTTMNTVTGGGNLTDIINQGLTPQAVGQYKDASGQMITAAPNTFVVSNPDGSGGALNYFFTVDPNTGATAPINNPAQNLTYTPGSPGGFIPGLISQAGDIIKTVAPIALDVVLIANGIPPWEAGAVTGSITSAANGGSLGDIAKAGLAGGAAGYVGGVASNAVGAGAPITSGIAGGAAAGATGAALTGQDILKGAATGGIVGAGAGALGLGDIAQKAVDTSATTAAINDTLKTFNAANPGASPTAQADFLINDPDLAGYNAKQISLALGASNPVTQAAAVIDQSIALNAQEVDAAKQSAVAPSTPAGSTQPGWTQQLADAYNSALTSKDWSAVDNIIKSNGLTADQIAQTYSITDPNTLAQIHDIVTNGTGTPLDNVNVTGSSTGAGATTPGVTTPTGNDLNQVTVTASKGTGLTVPPTPPVTPVVPNVDLNPITVTASKGTGLTVPPTPPLIPLTPITTPTTVVKPVVVPPTVIPPTPAVVPVVTPPKVTTTSVGPTTLPPTVFGTSPVGQVNTGAGYLNPGLITPQTYYKNDTSPVQSQYYWGAHPFQTGGATGQVFDPSLYNQVPGGTHPWGLQQMGTSLTTAQLQALINGQNITPGVVSGPIAPTAVKA